MGKTPMGFVEIENVQMPSQLLGKLTRIRRMIGKVYKN